MVQAARAHRRRQDARPFQVRQAGEERVDVTMAQGIRAQPGVGASAQVLGQQPYGRDDGPHRPGGHGHQCVRRPRLGQVFEPRLGDRSAGRAAVRGAADEGQPSDGAEHAQIPDVFPPLGFRVRSCQGRAVGGEPQEPSHRVASCAGVDVGDAGRPAPAQQLRRSADVLDRQATPL